MTRKSRRWWRFGAAPVALVALACSGTATVTDNQGGSLDGGTGGTGGTGTGGGSATGGTSASGGSGGDMTSSGGSAATAATGGSTTIPIDPGPDMSMAECPPTTCKAQGIGCGKVVDKCGKVIDCADEGLTCGPLQVCTGGVDMPATCQVAGGAPCELCAAVKDCSSAAQKTKLTGRVITPGRTDTNTPNQLGVPNAFVYILRNDNVDDLPAISSGIPAGATSCDRCEDQDFGPVLVSATTDATGAFTLEGNVPVGQEFVLVVKAGRFRRAIKYTIPAEGACQTTALPTTLPDNPARLPRDMMDGLAVNIPRIAVTTGGIDAMECVLEKMGISHAEFGNPGATGDAAPRVHIYQGKPSSGMGTTGDGSKIDASTPLEDVIYGDPSRLESYDMLLADCEGRDADDVPLTERDAYGANVIDYVNRGGRMFVSHLRYSWLVGNGMQAYDPANPYTTGLDAAATWSTADNHLVSTGTGEVAVGRPLASPRIQNFADWMANEGVAMPPAYTFDIAQPRSQAATLGMSSEEFVLTTSTVSTTQTNMGQMMMTTKMGDITQQFSFNTPYGAPDSAVCGRVAYSGFHVVADASATMGMTQPFENTIFPSECVGDLSAQEKVLLYMLFDLNACVGMPPEPPACTPSTCDSLMLKCGFSGDGCGGVIDCGPCPLPIPR